MTLYGQYPIEEIAGLRTLVDQQEKEISKLYDRLDEQGDANAVRINEARERITALEIALLDSVPRSVLDDGAREIVSLRAHAVDLAQANDILLSRLSGALRFIESTERGANLALNNDRRAAEGLPLTTYVGGQ